MKNSASLSEMILIPEGEFLSGSTSVGERPCRLVYLDDYRIGRNPVTVREFLEFCSENQISISKFHRPRWGWIDDHPMVRVSWHIAREYCLWAGGDLPTEAQWEKAARGTNGRIFPWGDDWDPSACQRSWRSLGDAGATSPIESFPMGASHYGCLDMAGNVWEWCLDWYEEDRSRQETRNPIGPEFGTSKVMRGGSWFYRDRKNFRTTHRKHLGPQFHNYDRGFRLVLPA